MRAISLTAAAVVALVSNFPAFALQRVFVSSTGSDSNACTPTAPCRSFAHAMTVVDPGGEILALDSAGYGSVTVTKSVSILGNPGFYAGIAAGSGTAVTISTAGVDVILRGLNINGIGANTGISMTTGSSLSVENCVVSNFINSAISISGTSAPDVRIVNTLVRGNGGHSVQYTAAGKLDVVNTTIIGNGGVGLFATNNTGTGTLTAHVTGSVFSQNGWGLVADTETAAGATTKVNVVGSTAANNTNSGFQTQNSAGGTVVLVVSGSTTGGNAVGLANVGGTLESTGNNDLRNNGTSTSGTITAVGLN